MKFNFKTVFFINNDLFFYLDFVLDLETSPGAGEYLLKSLYEKMNKEIRSYRVSHIISDSFWP